MSRLYIRELILSGHKSLEDGNYWSALSIALLLPSVCSRVEFDGIEEYYNNKNKFRDKKCYIDWCNKYMCENEIYYDKCNSPYLIDVLGKEYAEVLYDLRCDFVHAGSPKTSVDGKRIYFYYGKTSKNTEFLGKYKIININDLCDCILGYANKWLNHRYNNREQYTFYFHEQNEDDSLLYERLCDRVRPGKQIEATDKRVDILEKEFEDDWERWKKENSQYEKNLR